MSSVSIYLLFSLLIITLNCSTSEQLNDKSSFDVVQDSVDVWFDLMPGPSTGRFHLKGKIKLENSSSADIKYLNLKAIAVHSNQEVIYNFKPYFKPVVKGEDYSLNTGISCICFVSVYHPTARSLLSLECNSKKSISIISSILFFVLVSP